jgi:hypothetical protein
VQGLLLDSVDLRGGRNPGDVEDRRTDVDGVDEVGAERATVTDARRPMNHHGVACSAQVRTHLLPHLNGVFPAHAHAAE